MDYYEIGQKIRKYRREKGFSQEQLAEAVNISVTHMSHIETANTKLSLPVLVDIAKTLQVSTDSLLFRHTFRQENTVNELLQVLSTCTPQQIKLVCELAKTVKNTEGWLCLQLCAGLLVIKNYNMILWVWLRANKKKYITSLVFSMSWVSF